MPTSGAARATLRVLVGSEHTHWAQDACKVLVPEHTWHGELMSVPLTLSVHKCAEGSSQALGHSAGVRVWADRLSVNYALATVSGNRETATIRKWCSEPTEHHLAHRSRSHISSQAPIWQLELGNLKQTIVRAFVSYMLNCSVVSDPLQPHGRQSTRLLYPWDFPSENTGWAAISSSGGPSRPRDQTCVSHVSCIAGGFLITEHTPRKLSNAKSGIPFSRKPVDKTSTSPRKRTIPTLPGCCACCCSCPRVRLCLGQCTPKAASELRGNEQDE